LLHFKRRVDLPRTVNGRLRFVVVNNGIARCDALIANVRPRVIDGGRNQLADNDLTLVAK
jgi:hypothetical protein